MKKTLLSILLGTSLLVAGCGTSSGSGSSGNDEKTLIMGTSADYPPFEYIDTAKGEEIIGFDVDLANALAEKVGYEVEVKDMDFSGLIEAVKGGQVDLVLAGMTPTEERKKSVDFTDIYYVAKDMIVYKDGTPISSEEDLSGLTVGVQLGSIQEDSAKELAEQYGFTVESRNRIPELVQEVVNGRFDAAIIENTVAKGFMENNKDLKGYTMEVDEAEAGSAIAFPKDSELTAKFNEALQEMKDNGELDELVNKWFGDANE